MVVLDLYLPHHLVQHLLLAVHDRLDVRVHLPEVLVQERNELLLQVGRYRLSGHRGDKSSYLLTKLLFLKLVLLYFAARYTEYSSILGH